MHITDITTKIDILIDKLNKLGSRLLSLSDEKAGTIAAYEKRMAKEIVELKANGHPVTLVEKLAKGKCAKESIEMHTAEAMYKTTMTLIQITMAQLNALQTKSKYLID